MTRARIAILAAAIGALVALWPAAAVAAPKASLSISGVRVDAGELRFAVTPHHLAAGVRIEPGSVRATAGGQPLTLVAEQTPPAEGLAARGLVIVLDATSRQSTGQLAAAKAMAQSAVEALPADVRVGLVAVRSKPAVTLAPTADRIAFTQALSALVPEGTGSTLDALVAAGAAFDAATFPAGSERRVLVISDGRIGTSASIETSSAAATQAAAPLAETGVVVDTIGLGYAAQYESFGMGSVAAFGRATGGTTVSASSAARATEAAAASGAAFAPPIALRAFVPTELAGKTARLEVSIAGSDLVGSAEVTFAPALAGAGPATATFGWVPEWAAIPIGVVLFAAILIAILAVAWPKSAKHDRIKQIENFGPGRVTAATAATAKPQLEGSAGGAIARTALAATASVVRSGQMESRITQRLERAGMRLRAPEWVLLRACISIAVGATFVTLGGGVAGAILGIVVGWVATHLYQTVRIDRRNAAFIDQLPDALQLLIGSLRSGFSLSQALDALVREAPEPVSAEFGRALAEHRLGADVSEALERLAQRTESEDLGWAVMAVRIQREVGGNLAEVLQTTVDTMRERARLRRHVLALSAEGRISAWVLICLPIVLALFMMFYRSDYMAPLLETPVGITLLVGGGLLFVIGIFWMIRVVKVDA